MMRLRMAEAVRRLKAEAEQREVARLEEARKRERVEEFSRATYPKILATATHVLMGLRERGIDKEPRPGLFEAVQQLEIAIEDGQLAGAMTCTCRSCRVPLVRKLQGLRLVPTPGRGRWVRDLERGVDVWTQDDGTPYAGIPPA